VRPPNRQGRKRLVRIVEVRERVVVVDTNHPRAGQPLELEVELVTIHTPDAAWL
jgi:FKBP-type peptidyl-prolyl cis-trans isomerase 2